jgi:lambda family phage portal protein
MAARNVIDRVVGYFSPRAGLERHFHRRQLARAYEAASPRDTWKPRRAGASANADHRADATLLRAKSRSLVQNVPYVAAGLGNLVDSTIGAGVKDHATGPGAQEIDALKALWKMECDADGRLDYDGVLAAAYRAMEQDGEVLIRLRPRFATDALAVPLQIQLLEIDWLDSNRTGGYNGNTIVNGVEYDVLGRIVAYWLWSTHPGDVGLLRGMRVQSYRVDAKSIIHLYNPERPGQGRGFPRLAPVIARVRDLSTYEDAELARKNLESRLGVLYSGDPTQLANPAADGELATQAEADSSGNLGELRSGAITRLPAGSEVTVVTPTVAEGYTDYVRQQLHLIASGMGVTYEMLTGDMNEVNFSSARVRRLDMRRSVERMQWLTLKPRLLDPLHRAFIDAAVLAGKLRRPANYAVAYSFPKWDYVNPQQEIEADTKEIAAGLCSISEKIRQRGDDPDAVFAELASDFGKLKASGTLDILLFLQGGGKPYVDPAEAAKEAGAATAKAAATARQEDEQRRELEQRSEERFGLLVGAIAQQQPASVTIRAGDTTVHMPERTLTVEAPVVNVAAAEAPVVNVRNEAPIVNVPAQEPAVVNVAPTEVRVDVQPATVELKMPKRKQVSEHERDKSGRIKRTTTTEE